LSKVKLTRKKLISVIVKFSPNSGQVPSVAEKNFLGKVRELDMYGVDPHPCKVRVFGFQGVFLNLETFLYLLSSSSFQTYM